MRKMVLGLYFAKYVADLDEQLTVECMVGIREVYHIKFN